MKKHLLILTLWASTFLTAFGQGPVFNSQTFEVAEASGVGTEVGTLVATDPDGDSLTFSILINTDPDNDQVPAFSIEEDRVLVADPGDLDRQDNPSLSIIIRASDGTLSTNALITVNLTEPETRVTLSSSSVPQNAIEFTLIGTLDTPDSDSEFHTYRLLTETDPISSELIVFTDEWRYLDDGSDQGIAWREPEFDDEDWLSGDSPLGYGTFGSDTPATFLSFGGDSNNKIPTTYFRQIFEIDDPLLVDSLTIDLEVDDGVILYINGTESLRANADGTSSFDDYASETVGGGNITETPSQFTLTDGLAPLLRSGTNTVAVEVHQANNTSSDLWLNLELKATLRQTGISDAEHFYLIGNRLFINKAVAETDRTEGSSFSIPIQSTDDQGNEVTDEIMVTVGPSSLDPPQDIELDGTELTEQQAAGTVVGKLSATDPDGNSFTFSVGSDPDYPANDFFTTAGELLVTTAPLDFDDKPRVAVLVTVTDNTGLSDSSEFFINLTRLEEPPTGITIDPGTLPPNAAPGTLIGTLQAIDPNANQEHTFELGTWPAVAGEPVIPFGSSWSYLDDGSDQGTAWTSTDFDDTSWPAGQAQLGYGDGDEFTTVEFIDTDPLTGGVQKNATTYFRHLFEINEPAVSGYLFRILYDDGAMIYVNGILFASSSNIPLNTNFDTFATGTTDDNSISEYLIIPPGIIEAGDNVIAVEIHQANNTSSDISFDFELIPIEGIQYRDYFTIDGNELRAAKDFRELEIVPPFTFQVPVVATDPFSGSVESLVLIRLNFADTDDDGLYDSVETDTGVFVSEQDTGTDPDNPDTDEDGWKDGAEIKLKTSPFDDQSRPAFKAVIRRTLNDQDQFTLLFPASKGQTYSVEGSADLRAWQVLEPGIEGDDDAVQRTYPATEILQFFRVKRQ